MFDETADRRLPTSDANGTPTTTEPEPSEPPRTDSEDAQTSVVWSYSGRCSGGWAFTLERLAAPRHRSRSARRSRSRSRKNEPKPPNPPDVEEQVRAAEEAAADPNAGGAGSAARRERSWLNAQPPLHWPELSDATLIVPDWDGTETEADAVDPIDVATPGVFGGTRLSPIHLSSSRNRSRSRSAHRSQSRSRRGRRNDGNGRYNLRPLDRTVVEQYLPTFVEEYVRAAEEAAAYLNAGRARPSARRRRRRQRSWLSAQPPLNWAEVRDAIPIVPERDRTATEADAPRAVGLTPPPPSSTEQMREEDHE